MQTKVTGGSLESLVDNILKIQLMLLFIVFESLSAAPIFADEVPTQIKYPIGELFLPLVSNSKEPQFSFGFHEVNTSGRLGRFTAAVVSYGEHFGLRRWQTGADKQWQVSILGAVFAQLNMDGESKDLINADYTMGVSGTHRHGAVSYRLQILHQSTHLGDEFLLDASAPERINYSFEAANFIAAYKWNDYRIYGGVGYLLSVKPGFLDKASTATGKF